MNIGKEDFIREYCIEIEDKLVYPKYEYESFDIETMSYTGLTIIKTAQEMYEESQKQIDICPTKTVEERLEEAEQRLAEKDQENKMLKAQVEANASSYEFLESCIMEMAEKVYA